MAKKIVIAIDGHSSCGKSTMAKELAQSIGYTYIDTGAMYRAVTLYGLEKGYIKDGEICEEALRKDISSIHITFERTAEGNLITFLNGKNVENKIRTMEVSDNVSLVSKLKFVREAMVAQQQEMGRKKGVVLDGRDIGSVVFPDAELKVFITATPEVRAERRMKELLAKGENVTFDQVLKNLQERDRIDSTRKESPLVMAPDALLLDNSGLSKEEQRCWLLNEFYKTAGLE
ncbi:MAG: (d)CMP kinase [Bacteroidales bacterium]|nr:(d)CMP kinase [Bacteroidales bacterium]